MERQGFINAFTVDVEDAINQAMRTFFHTDINPTYRVYDNTLRLLDLLDEYKVNATFFILGEVARSYPLLIKKISDKGHELGIHGYSHARYYHISKEAVRQEIIRSKRIVEDISGQEVLGHRAPAFSIGPGMQWVLKILLDADIKYDSSIFPAKTARYGWRGFNRNIDWMKLDDGRALIEAPLTTINILGMELPSCGGGYLRALPFFLTDRMFRCITRNRPVNVYMHPYEIDPPPFPEFYMNLVNQSSLANKLQLKAYWYNRESVIPKLRKLLSQYNFTTLRNVINNVLKTDL